MNWIWAILFFGAIFGIIWLRDYVGERAAEGRRRRESAD